MAYYYNNVQIFPVLGFAEIYRRAVFIIMEVLFKKQFGYNLAMPDSKQIYADKQLYLLTHSTSCMVLLLLILYNCSYSI